MASKSNQVSAEKEGSPSQELRGSDGSGNYYGAELEGIGEDEIGFEDEQQIYEAILALGNEIWRNFGQEEPIEEIQIFFQHQFYVRCFQFIYPEHDFSQLLENEEEESAQHMADCIQALIDLLAEEILSQEIGHISGEQIVKGNYEHCINFLQILQQISAVTMMQEESGEEKEFVPPDQPNSSEKKDSNNELPQKSDHSPQSLGDQVAGKPFMEGEDPMGVQWDQFPGEEGAEEDGEDKQQLYDDLDIDLNVNGDEEKEEKKWDDKVGDIGQQLDIEFDDDIKDNLQNLRGSGGAESSAQPDGHSPGQEEDEENQAIIDHNEVDIIDDGEHFEEEYHEDDMYIMKEDEDDGSPQEEAIGEEDESEHRNLNRQTDNMADFEKDANGYPIAPGHMVEDDDDGLGQLHAELQNLDNMEHGMPEQEPEDEDEHYQEDDNDDIAEIEQYQNYEEEEEVDPRMLAQMGMKEEQMHMAQEQVVEEGDSQENDMELAEMLNGVPDTTDPNYNGQQFFDEEDNQILRGSQNIEDEQSPAPGEEEYDEDEAHWQQQQQLAQVPLEDDDDKEEGQEEVALQQEGEDEEEYGGEEQQEINDFNMMSPEQQEYLISYFQKQYANQPGQPPLTKEQIAALLRQYPRLDFNQEMAEDEGEEQVELPEGIDSNEIIVENGPMMGQDPQAMMIEGDHVVDDEDEQQEDDEAEVIQGGEEDIIEEEAAFQHPQQQEEIGQDYGEEQQADPEQQLRFQQMLAMQQEQAYGEEVEVEGEGEEEQEFQNQQIFQPQYQVNDVAPEGSDPEDQQDMMVNLQMQHQQMALQGGYPPQPQQQWIPAPIQETKVVKKKKPSTAVSRKPPIASSQRQPSLAAAGASKNYRRNKAGINTISHEVEERQRVSGRYFNSQTGNRSHMKKTKKSGSAKQRPQTAKPLRGLSGGSATVGRSSKPKVNNFLSQSIPNHPARPGRNSKPSFQMGTVQQKPKHMFTSFGANTSTQATHKKAAAKKAYGRSKPSTQVNIAIKKGKKKTTSPPQQQQQQAAQLTPEQQQQILAMLDPQKFAEVAAMNPDQQFPNYANVLLDQLDEQQLKMLLANQQLLYAQRNQMQLQEEEPEQPEEVAEEEDVYQVENAEDMEADDQDEDDQQEQDQMAEQMVQQMPQQMPDQFRDQMQDPMADQMVDQMTDQMADQMAEQMVAPGAPMMPAQMFQMQQPPLPPEMASLRNRGRSAKNSHPIARLPPSGMKAATVGSASRSRKGSKKRTTKTRSSLNIASGPSIQSMGPSISSIPIPSTSVPGVTRSQKMALQVYSSENMLHNLVSTRKRNTTQQKKSKKRSQPNQGLHSQKHFNKMGQLRGLNDQGILNQQYSVQGAIQNQAQQYSLLNNDEWAAQGDSAAADSKNPTQISNMVPQALSFANDLSTQQIIDLLQQNQAVAEASEGHINLGETNINEGENGELILQGQLPQDVQNQLQQVLQHRILQQQQQQQFLLQQQQMMGGQVNPQLAGNVDIVKESVSKARQQFAHLGPGSELRRNKLRSDEPSPEKQRFASGGNDQSNLEADDRIIKQKKQFEQLMKQYQLEIRKNETQRQKDLKRAQKIAARDEKISAIKQRRYEEELIAQQKSQMIKRDSQQKRLQKKVDRLAMDFERNKRLEEKKVFKEHEAKKKSEKQMLISKIETFYKDKINMLKDRIEQEKMERHLAEGAQKKAISQRKKELDDMRRKEVQRYIQILQQQDDKFDVNNLNLGKYEKEVLKFYKKK